MNKVADPTADVMAMNQDWVLAAALLGGTRTMRAAGTALMPKWPNEANEAYQARLQTATLFPAYSRTVQTLTGKPFSKPVTVGDDVPPVLVEYMQDVDLEGRNLDAFAADVMECALGYGLTGILVDYPVTENVRTLADERAQGSRPYWIHIKPQQILGWRALRINGAWAIEQLRLMESVSVPDGQWGEIEIQQVRVLTPGAWQIYRQNEKKEWLLFIEGVTTLGYVPFVPVYGQRTGFMKARPPLIEMAHLNIEHWQSSSDQRTILHVARVPILAVIGVDDDKWSLTVGASSAVKLPIGSDMKYVEHGGAAIQAGADSLVSLEEQMRQAGAELLVLQASVATTATQIASENAVGMCALQRISQGLEDALDQALQMTADWLKIPEGGHIAIFNDFAIAPINNEATGLLASVTAGLISKTTAINEMKRRGILSAEVDAETEAALIDGEGPALGMMDDAAGTLQTDTPVTPNEPAAPTAPALDISPLTDAILSLVGRMDAQMTQEVNEPKPVAPIPTDLTALITAIANRPDPVVNMEAVIDATPIAEAVAKAIAAIPRQEAPIINMPPITIEQPSITINNPPAAPINIAQPAINIASPSPNKSATMTKQADGSYVMQVTSTTE